MIHDTNTVTAGEWAKAQGVPYTTAADWAQQGLLPGAVKVRIGDLRLWQIPVDCPRPDLPKGRPKKGTQPRRQA